uniref:hypothetical protein n=1 Tax=Nonomuraea sp. CA-252377 TaxID=3240003 RepID=UPI003F497AF6
MLPEVKAFYDALDDRTHRIETERVRAAHPVPAWDHTMPPSQLAAYFQAEDQQNAALRKLEQARKRTQAEAYQKLLASENPLVRFLLTDPEVQAYPQHAETALKTLPMTREEMEEFGAHQDWCREYGRLLDRADAAGVLPAPLPDLADIDPLVRDIVSWSGLTPHERALRASIRKHLPDILTSAQTAGVLPSTPPDVADIGPLVRDIVSWSDLDERRLRTTIRKHLPDILASARTTNTQPVPANPPATA